MELRRIDKSDRCEPIIFVPPPTDDPKAGVVSLKGGSLERAKVQCVVGEDDEILLRVYPSNALVATGCRECGCWRPQEFTLGKAVQISAGDWLCLMLSPTSAKFVYSVHRTGPRRVDRTALTPP